MDLGSSSGESLLDIRNYIICMLDTDGQANQLRSNSTRFLLFFIQLRMSGGSRMNRKAPGISNIGKVRE
jgi:hypothetical protein